MDVGNDDPLGSYVQKLEHRGTADLADPGQRRDARQLRGTDKIRGPFRLEGTVLVIHDQEIESRFPQGLDHELRTELEEGSDGPRTRR